MLGLLRNEAIQPKLRNLGVHSTHLNPPERNRGRRRGPFRRAQGVRKDNNRFFLADVLLNILSLNFEYQKRGFTGLSNNLVEVAQMYSAASEIYVGRELQSGKAVRNEFIQLYAEEQEKGKDTLKDVL